MTKKRKKRQKKEVIIYHRYFHRTFATPLKSRSCSAEIGSQVNIKSFICSSTRREEKKKKELREHEIFSPVNYSRKL